MCLTASLLSSAVPTGYRGPGGSDIPPWVSRMYIWYQSVPAPLPALLDLGGSWKDLLRPRRACSYMWRLAHCPGGEWMPFHFAWVLRSFRSGRRWPAVRPGNWVLVGPRWGWADSCPAAGQRLPWMEFRLEVGSAGVAYH